MSPIFFSCPGILCHNAIVNGSPRKQDITFENIFGCMWNSLQEFFLSGKRELKVVRNELLELVNLESINERDATSAILFCSPGIPLRVMVIFGACVGVLLGLLAGVLL